MKTICEVIKYSDREGDRRTDNHKGDLFELIDDAKKTVDTRVEMFLEVMESITGDISNYHVDWLDSMDVEVVYIDPDNGTRRIDMGFSIVFRQLH